MIQFIQNMLVKMIGPSNETVANIKPWIIWGFIGLITLSLFIYFIGNAFLFKEGPGFWSITGNTFKPLIPHVNINNETNVNNKESPSSSISS